MMDTAEGETKALQRDVQRLLGRCLLRLQQYERLIKALVTHGALSATAGNMTAALDARVSSTARQTLGQLVGEFLGSHLVSGEPKALPEKTADDPGGVASFSFRIRLGLPEEEFAQTERDLGDLVQLRNDLVHHFIDQHDLWSVAGCRAAQAALIVTCDRIGQSYARLQVWAEDMDRARQKIVESMQSEVFRDLVVHGIAPDGSVDWPIPEIVRVLKIAAGELAVDGWTSVAEAAKWIEKRHPDESPAKYGRKTWQQVAQESQVFELRNFGEEGERSARYRERAKPPKRDTDEREWEIGADCLQSDSD